jgi:hypothetical protein
MTDQRSTRRVIQEETSDKTGPTADGVKSIISEIDGIVDGLPAVGKQVANSKGQAPMTEATTDHARMQPQDAFQFTPDSKDETFDINQLEQELSVAIAAELGDDPTGEETSEETRTEVDTNHEGASVPADSGSSRSREAQEERATTADETGPDDLPSARSARVDRLLRPLSAPVERLSPNGRQVLNVITISTALWVPVVWLAIMTDGFGLLSIETPAGVTIAGDEVFDPTVMP